MKRGSRREGMNFELKGITRRNFLNSAVGAGAGAVLGFSCLWTAFSGGSEEGVRGVRRGEGSGHGRDAESHTGASPPSALRQAMFYEKLANDNVRCMICFRMCTISEGGRGECRNRENFRGELFSVVHSRPSAIQIDPIEKEPQYHMLPGSTILCFGTAGCNFRCRGCQNWHLSQRSLEELEYYYQLSPEGAVKEAIKREVPTVSFTYNEPTSFYEYAYDIAVAAKKSGIKILWHSNGALNMKPLKALLAYTDAVTIDLKGFTDNFYIKYSSAELKPVLETLKTIRHEGKWLEIVNLVIPTLNDDPSDIRRMCEWIKENLGPDVPVHFSRFFPAYRLTGVPPTPVETLERAYEIAKRVGLDYVTLGNVPGHRYNSTYCPRCAKVLIGRVHFQVMEINLKGGKCPSCGHPIPGVWTA